jgi:hypothetical protein
VSLHRPTAPAVVRGGFTAEPAAQFHLDLGAVTLGNLVEERVLVAFPGSVGREPSQVEGAQAPDGEFAADAYDARQGVFGVFDPVPAFVFAGDI